jgi:DNA-binding response OmpR family regulator
MRIDEHGGLSPLDGCAIDTAQRAEPLPGVVPPQGRALVLVVVDDAELLRMIAKVLTTGYRVATAASGVDGLVQAMALRPDLIVSDIQTPGSTVSDLQQAVRRRTELNRVPFLLLMDGCQEAVELRASSRTGEDYLCKPFTLSELRARVAMYVTLKRVLDVPQPELVVTTSQSTRMSVWK